MPEEIDDLFTHIIERIPIHYKSDSMRYLKMVWKWHVEKMLCRPYQLMLPVAVLAIGKAASNQSVSEKLVSLSATEIARRVEGIEIRLQSCCLGLLAVVHRDPDDRLSNPKGDDQTSRPQPFVAQVLHRLVFDYLRRPDTQKVLDLGAGEGFDVNLAILTGLVANYKLDPSWPTESFNMRIISIFNFNRLAELSTGQAQSRILTCIDRIMIAESRRVPAPTHQSHQSQILQPQCWTDQLLEDYNRPCEWHTNLLAHTVRTGASFYLRDQVNSDKNVMEKQGRPLLDYAAFPEPCYSPHVHGMNPEAARILLHHGADPNSKFNGWSPWQNALYFTRKVGVNLPVVCRREEPNEWEDPVQQISELNVPYVREMLDTLRVFLEYRADFDAYCERAIDGGFHCEVRRWNAFQVVQACILGARCCGDTTLNVCKCAAAEALRPMAYHILGIVQKHQQSSRFGEDEHICQKWGEQWLPITDYRDAGDLLQAMKRRMVVSAASYINLDLDAALAVDVLPHYKLNKSDGTLLGLIAPDRLIRKLSGFIIENWEKMGLLSFQPSQLGERDSTF